MKFLILICCIAAISGRYVREELVATPWMHRVWKNDKESRIFRGEPAEIEDFPYMLAYLDLSTGGFRCGASTIGSHWALTAAHCVENNSPVTLRSLRGGSTNRNSGGYIFQLEAFWIHPGYNSRLEYDIAIMRTVQAIEGTNVAPIALPPVCNEVCCGVCAGVQMVVTGWGQTETGPTATLRQLRASVHEWSDCMRIWNRNGPSFVCKVVVGGRDTCGGDSGSPLVTGIGKDRVQHALVSFGTFFCGAGAPSVNIRIEHGPIRNWITAHSGV